MFDFAADGRDEGGEHGINQKGLVSFDRKVKKDAFFAYKAAWSKEPFVHLCGKRYVDRTEEITEVKVYSNQSAVSLYQDGKLVGRQKGKRIFRFYLPLTGEQTLEAKTDDGIVDTIQVRKVMTANPDYMLPKIDIMNWFDRDENPSPEGYFSIKDTMESIKAVPQGAAVIEKLMEAARASRGDVAEGIQYNEMMQRMLDAMTVEKLLQQVSRGFSREQIIELNRTLNNIKK